MAPDVSGHRVTLAGVLMLQNRIDEAVGIYRDVLVLWPDNEDAIHQLAHLLESVNRLDEARDVAVAGLALDPENMRCSSVVAKCLRRKGELQAAHRLCENALTLESSTQGYAPLHYESASILDELNRPADAMARIRSAAELEKRTYQGPLGRDSHLAHDTQRVLQRLRSGWVNAWSDLPDDGVGKPLAVLCGFPRSGTTLVERTLAAHPDVTSFEERPTFVSLQGKLSQHQNGYPDAIGTMTQQERNELRKTYRALLSIWSQDLAKTCLLDKLPLHTLNIPLIHRVFPRVKFLLALRHPCDVILSCYMQQFALNDGMSNFVDLDDAVRLYADTMSIWIECSEQLD
jgi:tetratricopeptide (TPR) repeat protein